MIGHIFNPISAYFRPFGMLCYWVLLRCFDLSAAPYHWLAWSLHTTNTALVYLILKRLTKARSGAAVGAMLFASQAVFAEIYWDFGTISELLAAFFSFAGLLLWMSERRDWTQVALASVLLFLAMKSKEMAVAMPLVWFSYDLLFAKDIDRKGIAQWILPGGLASLYGLAKASMMRGVVRADPYYMSVKGSTLASGFKIYLNMLFRTNFPWQIWCLGFLALRASLPALAQSSRVLLPIVRFHHIPSRHFPYQSPLCVLLVSSIPWCVWPYGNDGEPHRRQDHGAKSTVPRKIRHVLCICSTLLGHFRCA
jgi:hypothetical protein